MKSPAQRAANWLVAQMNPDGSLRGATSINEYYKTVFALAVAGRVGEADRMFEYIVGRFLKKDGDLDGVGCEWFDQFCIYPHTWIAMAAIVRARFDVAAPMVRFLESFHDENTGGFYGTREQREKNGEQEMMSTGLAAIALLWAGRTDVALRTAQWMKTVWEAQPDLQAGLYFVWHHRNGLVAEFPAAAARSYLVNTKESAQRYYQYGIAAAFLAALFGATGDRAWLELGRAYLHASRYCREDVYRRPQSGKLGWGAAWTHRFTRDPKDLALAKMVHEGLARDQQPDGWWPQEYVYGGEKSAAVTPGLDLTGEFLAHLSWIESAVAAIRIAGTGDETDA